MFGSNTSQTTTFGQSQPQPQPQTQSQTTSGLSSSMFGMQPRSSVNNNLGVNSSQQNTGGFGGAGNSSNIGGFGNSSVYGNTNSNGSNSAGNTLNSNTNNTNNSAANVSQELLSLRDSWNPNSANYAFQYYFYNKVPANEVMMYVKPPNQDQAKWDEAMNNRPDFTSVPALALGFGDLQKRMDVQRAQAAAYRSRLYELNKKIDDMTTRHDLHTTVKIGEMKQRNLELAHKTLKLAVKVHMLRSRGLVLRKDEETLKEKLEYLHSYAGDSAIYGRINEVWARMAALQEMVRVMKQQSNKLIDDFKVDWGKEGEEVNQLTEILKEQQEGIAFLSTILGEDAAAIEEYLNKQTKPVRSSSS